MRLLLAMVVAIFAFPVITFAETATSTMEQRYFHATVQSLDANDDSDTLEVNLKITDKSRKDQTVSALWSNKTQSRNFSVEKGSRVIVSCTSLEEEEVCNIISLDRNIPLLWLGLLFVATILFINRKRGFKALVAMSLSMVVIGAIMIPLILKGWSPFWVSLLGGLCIIIPTIYITHGVGAKSHIALASIGIASTIIVLLAAFFTQQLQLLGLGSEEALYLNPSINLSGVLLSSVLLGTLGVTDDLAFTQVSIVNELYHSNSSLSPRALFARAMQVGHDHIASVINTLFLAYAGVAFPLLLLIGQNNIPLSIALQQEAVATEIMRTCVGTIGLLFVVPLATWLSARFIHEYPHHFPPEAHHGAH